MLAFQQLAQSLTHAFTDSCSYHLGALSLSSCCSHSISLLRSLYHLAALTLSSCCSHSPALNNVYICIYSSPITCIYNQYISSSPPPPRPSPLLRPPSFLCLLRSRALALLCSAVEDVPLASRQEVLQPRLGLALALAYP